MVLTPADLVAFEDRMAKRFAAGDIRAPLHLAGGNERQLIDYFEEHVKPGDYKLCSWRSHYHALLTGVPESEVESAILDGRSIALCFPAHRMLSSAIVAGICPIAAGLGWAIKRRRGTERVHCFVGDMTATTGIYHEAIKYCTGHCLPVSFIVEDNGLSVCTDTQNAWGGWFGKSAQTRYAYELTRPHVGIGKFVQF